MKKSLYNQEYFEERAYLDPKIASSVEILAKTNALKTVLDVGCGTGKLVEYLNKRGFETYGCDPYAKVSADKIFTKASATKLPFKNKSFDLITSISVIEHLKKSEVIKFIAEVKRVLNDSGHIFLVTPNYNSMWRIILGKRWFGYSDPTHINFYTPSSLSKLLKEYGFKKITFSFKTRNLGFTDFLLVSTFLWRVRNSFYVSGQKR